MNSSGEEVVEKLRFLNDFDSMNNYISFFNLNQTYTEARAYLEKFKRLRIISINRYYLYITNSIKNHFLDFDGIENQDEFFSYVMNFQPKSIDRKYYSFPKNFEKLKQVQIFFEEKSKTYHDVKENIDITKANFIKQRYGVMSKFYDKIFEDMTTSFKVNRDSKQYFSDIFEIFKISICEIFYYIELFQTQIIDNTFILQNHINYIYDSLYSTLRPIIIHFHSIDELIILFNCISNYFSMFFIEENIDNPNRDISCNKITANSDYYHSEVENPNQTDYDNYVNQEHEAFQQRIFDIMNSLINNEVNIFSMPSNVANEKATINTDIPKCNRKENDNDMSRIKPISFELFKNNFYKINEAIQVSKILIRPTLIKIVQDIQEKIFLKISQHLKNNLLDIDQDLQYISKYEEVLNSSYENFSLFHFFLRKLSVLLELLRNILSKTVLNDISVLAIEKFIQILNEEILNKKNLNYEFQLYIIQQLILAIKLLNEFEVEAIETEIEIDLFSITEAFKNNFHNIFYENNISIKEMIINSAPKIYDNTRDFKKILFNNLLKSYKILINIVNNFIFEKDNIDLVFKIRNKEKIEEKSFEGIIGRNYDNFLDIYMKFDTILQEIKNQIFIVDENISEKLSSMILDNCYNILRVLKDELNKKLNLNLTSETMLTNINHLFDHIKSDEKHSNDNTNLKYSKNNPYMKIYQQIVDFIEGEFSNMNMKNMKLEMFKKND